MTKTIAGGMTQQVLHLNTEIESLKQQLLVQGEQLNQEILERRALVDGLKLEVDTLKRFLEEVQPGFTSRYENLYDEERERFDPEKVA